MKVTLINDLVSTFETKLFAFIKKYDIEYTYVKSNPYVCEDENSARYGMALVDIEIEANYKIGNFDFIATCEWVPEQNENLIKKASEDVFVPSRYRTRKACDHCSTNRNRKSTIILRNRETQEFVQVGKGCLKEYTGVSMTRYAMFLSFFDKVEEYVEMCEQDKSVRIQRQYQVDDILEQTIEEVNRNGYVSRNLANETGKDSTAYTVCNILWGCKNMMTGELLHPRYKVSKKTKEDVEEIKNFYANYEDNTNSDYVKNLQLLLKCKWVKANDIGLVVSAKGMYERLLNQQKEDQIKIKSEFIGTEGGKITFIGKPICVYSDYNNFGKFYIYKIVTDEGKHIFSWKTQKRLNTEKEYQFNGTIRGFNTYRNEKQTVITKVREKELA